MANDDRTKVNRSRKENEYSSEQPSTFSDIVMEASKLNKENSSGYFADKSLYIFSKENFCRRFCRKMTESRSFEFLVITAILSNCIVLALEEHLPNNDKTERTIKLEKAEVYFLIFFTTEAVLKIISKGFIFGRGAYLRDNWNKLDFIVVVAGLLEYFFSSNDTFDLKILRLVRVLRPLKLVSGIPSLQIVMRTLFQSVKPLVPVVSLVLLTILVFAVLGMELYMGAFNNICVLLDKVQCKDSTCNEEYTDAQICQVDESGNGYHCTQNQSVCRPFWRGPHNGVTNFNNIGLAMLTVFQCLTMQGWTDILYWANDAKGTYYNWLYFLTLIIFGALFMMNIVIGILSGYLSLFHISAWTYMVRLENKTYGSPTKVFTRERQKTDDYKKKNLDQTEDEYRARLEWLSVGDRISRKEETTLPRQLSRDILTDFKKINTKEIWNDIRILFIRKFVTTEFFWWLVIFLVLTNTVIVASEHHGQPDWLTKLQFISEFVFVSLFFVEISLRIIALGFRQYFYFKFNIFDFVALTGSIGDIFLKYLIGIKPLKFSVLRSLRLLRVMEKTRHWKDITSLGKAMMNSITSIASLLFLLFLFLVISALMGMQIFGGRMNFESGRPANHFDNFVNAWLTVFQVVSSSCWNEVMFNGIEAYGGVQTYSGAMTIFYFLGLIVLGNYALLNVFVAIAVDSLESAKELSESEKQKSLKDPERQDDTTECDNSKERRGSLKADSEKDLNTSLFIFDANNKFRKKVQCIVNHKNFDRVLLAVILSSSVVLAAENPSDGLNSTLNRVLFYLDTVFVGLFCIEMVLKIIAKGFILHPGSYLRDKWNCFDAVIVITSIAALFQRRSTIKFLKVFRVLRVLRVLRTINKVQGLKVACQRFMKSFRSVSSFILVYMMMQFIFAVLGVQFLKGKFFYCTDKTKLSERECKGQFFEYNSGNLYSPVIQERRWLRHDFHFDNVFAAMLTLFVITTGEGWPTILLHARDAMHEDWGPEKDKNMEISIYFVIYIVIAPFFFLNIFIAMITVAFQDEEDNAKQYEGLSKNQRTCIQYVINTQPNSKFRVPENASNLRKVVRKVVISNTFENIVTVIVLLSTISLTLQYSTQTENWKNVIMYCNIVFTALFITEAALRIIGLGVKNYFRDGWNILDFVIVIIGIIEFFLYVFDEHHSFVKFRILRVLRIIKLLKRKKSLAVLLWTFVHSIKALPHVFCLNLLSLYIFAVAGMQLFGNIAIQEDSSITEYNNFHNVGQSFILLFRCVTGEDWHGIMMDCVSGQECVAEEDRICGTDIGAYIFFPTFIFLSSFLMMNLFVAVIVCNFDYFHRDPSELALCHLEEFGKKWMKYDPNATGYIKIDEFKSLVRNLDPPLGFGRRCPDFQLQQNFLKMNIKIEKEETKNEKTEMKSTRKEDKGLVDCNILCQHDKDRMGVNDHLRNENEEMKLNEQSTAFDQESRKLIHMESEDNENTRIMKSLKEENFECKDVNNRSENEDIHSDNSPCTKKGTSDGNSLLKVKFLSALFSLTRKALGLYKYDGSISNDANLKETIRRIFNPEDDKLDNMIPGTGKVYYGLRYYTAIQIWKNKTINKNKVIKRQRRLSKKGVLSSISDTLVGHRKRGSNILSQECSEVTNTEKNNTSTHVTTINETDIDQPCVGKTSKL